MAEAAGDWDLPPHKWSVNRDNNIPEHSPPRHEASHPSLCQQLLATFMPTRNIPNLQKETDQAVVTGHRKLVGSFQISWTISVRWSGATLTDVPPLSHPTLGLWGGIHSNSRCLWNGNLGHVNSQNYSQSCGPSTNRFVPYLVPTLTAGAGPDVNTRIIRWLQAPAGLAVRVLRVWTVTAVTCDIGNVPGHTAG